MNWIARLSLVQRVQALGLLAQLPLVALSAQLVSAQWGTLETARAERAGLPAAAQLLQLSKLTAEHRGMSAGLLGGNEAFAPRRGRARDQGHDRRQRREGGPGQRAGGQRRPAHRRNRDAGAPHGRCLAETVGRFRLATG